MAMLNLLTISRIFTSQERISRETALPFVAMNHKLHAVFSYG